MNQGMLVAFPDTEEVLRDGYLKAVEMHPEMKFTDSYLNEAVKAYETARHATMSYYGNSC